MVSVQQFSLLGRLNLSSRKRIFILLNGNYGGGVFSTEVDFSFGHSLASKILAQKFLPVFKRCQIHNLQHISIGFFDCLLQLKIHNFSTLKNSFKLNFSNEKSCIFQQFHKNLFNY